MTTDAPSTSAPAPESAPAPNPLREGSVTIAFEREPDVTDPLLVAVRLRSGKPSPLDVIVSHRGRAGSASVEFVAPEPRLLERTFGYREFAACLVGEIHRHEPNAALDAAAPVAAALTALGSTP